MSRRNAGERAYIPTPEDIEREKKAIQATWTPLRRSKATVTKPTPVSLHHIETDHMGMPKS